MALCHGAWRSAGRPCTTEEGGREARPTHYFMCTTEGMFHVCLEDMELETFEYASAACYEVVLC